MRMEGYIFILIDCKRFLHLILSSSSIFLILCHEIKTTKQASISPPRSGYNFLNKIINPFGLNCSNFKVSPFLINFFMSTKYRYYLPTFVRKIYRKIKFKKKKNRGREMLKTQNNFFVI